MQHSRPHPPILTFRAVFAIGMVLPAAAGAIDVVRAPYAPDSGSIDVRCGRLIDGLADEGLVDQLIRIENGRITLVAPYRQTPEPVRPLLDLSDHHCLPGLIDTHTHLTDQANETRDLSVYYTRPETEERRIARRNAEVTLFAGFTTARNVGAYSGWSADVGALVPGRFGDLIAVRGDPLEDVSRLQDVAVVIKGGLLFKHRRPAPGSR